MAPPGFCNRGKVRYGSIGGLEYEVLQSRLYCLCINVALCSTELQSICRVIRRSPMTMKAHTYYIIFGRPPIGGKLPPFPPGGATGYHCVQWQHKTATAQRDLSLAVPHKYGDLPRLIGRRLTERVVRCADSGLGVRTISPPQGDDRCLRLVLRVTGDRIGV